MCYQKRRADGDHSQAGVQLNQAVFANWAGSVLNEAFGRKMTHDPMHPAQEPEPTAPGGSLWRQDTVGGAMPVARRDWENALPDAWWGQGFRRPYRGTLSDMVNLTRAKDAV
jgi:hypothetical protein